MNENKFLRCSQCPKKIRPGESYSVICGEVYCRECEKEYLQNDIANRFDELQEQLEEVAGIPVYYLEEL